MSEYLIQSETMTNMANQMRRISGINYELSGAEIVERFSRTQGTVKTDGEYLAEIIDFDGTVIKSGTYDTDEIFAMPTYQSKNNLLEFQSWSSTSPITHNYITVGNTPMQVGAVMKPVDDCLIIGIETEEQNASVQLYANLYSTTIDWGDGVVETINNGYNFTAFTHTYANIGLYNVKFILHDSGGAQIFTSSVANHDSVTMPLIKYIYVPSWAGKIRGGFNGLINLEEITFASGITFDTDVTNFFNDCKSLRHITFPTTIQELPLEMFMVPNYGNGQYSSGLQSIILPYGITIITRKFFSGCDNLINVAIPNTVTNIEDAAFEYTGLKSVTIPDGVTQIGMQTFSNCQNLKCIKLLSSTVVSLVNTNAFLRTPIASGTGYIYVPDNLVNSYKTANNWSTYASKIKPLSQYVKV